MNIKPKVTFDTSHCKAHTFINNHVIVIYNKIDVKLLMRKRAIHPFLHLESKMQLTIKQTRLKYCCEACDTLIKKGLQHRWTEESIMTMSAVFSSYLIMVKVQMNREQV